MGLLMIIRREKGLLVSLFVWYFIIKKTQHMHNVFNHEYSNYEREILQSQSYNTMDNAW